LSWLSRIWISTRSVMHCSSSAIKSAIS